MAEQLRNLTIEDRKGPLTGRVFGANGCTLKPAAPAIRISLSAGAEGMAAANKVLGIALPVKPKSTALKVDLACLWLGPDEWLIIDSADSVLPEKFAKLGNSLLSAVDVSHRNTAIIVEGANVEAVLNSGCPQDLSLDVFHVGSCSRTILGKSEVVLFREAENRFRVECWRSFSDYVWKYLADAAKSA